MTELVGEVKICDNARYENITEAFFELYKGKISNSSSGMRNNDKHPPVRVAVHAINADGKRTLQNIYAQTREECEAKKSTYLAIDA